MRAGKIFCLICALVVCFSPLRAYAQPEPAAPDPVQAANDFITGLTGRPPAALGYAADAADLAAIGKMVLEGRHGEAMGKVGEFTAGKMIGSAAPAIGQFIAIGKIGKMAGDAAVNWVGQKNFEKIYTRMLETVGPVEQWPKSRQEAQRDEFFQGTMAAEYRYLETYLIQRGFAKNAAEAENVAVDMILSKGNFERLCDQYDLKGKDRTYANLETEIQIEAEVAAEIARDKELARVARLEEERKAKEKEEAEQEEEQEAEQKSALASLPAPSMPADYPQQIDETTQQPVVPKPHTSVPAKPKPLPAPEKPKPSSPASPIQWSVVPRLMGSDNTSFTITVTNVSGQAIPGFAVSLAPLNHSVDGGVGWGSPPSAQTLAPGASISITALAMGDAEGIAVSFSGGGGSLGALTARSIHSREKNADGTYQGGVTGIRNGAISLTVAGRSVRAVITGNYSDSSQNVKISAQGSGVYDPKTGTLAVKWGGGAVGKMVYEGKKRNVDEKLSGSFQGAFKDGGFAGKWTGGSEFIYLSGTWYAR